MPRYDVAAIKAAHPIVDVVEAAGIVLRRAGRAYVGRCPFHADTTASLNVYADTDSWWCFACSIGVDVIDFVGRLNGTGFRETAEVLSRGIGPLPANVTPIRPSRPSRRTPTPGELVVIDAAAAFYAQFLPDGEAQDYLGRRGVAAEVARRLGVGYGRPGLRGHLRRQGLSVAAAEAVGLVNGRLERFVGRLVVPDLDASGRATWLTGRATRKRRLRYLDLSIRSPLLGLARVRASGSDTVVVVEGPLDWLTACGWGVPAVSLNGSHADATALDALRTFRRVYLALDGNTAGRLAADRLAGELGDRATVVELPDEAHDLNLLGQSPGGRDQFIRLVAQAREEQEASAGTSIPAARAA